MKPLLRVATVGLVLVLAGCGGSGSDGGDGKKGSDAGAASKSTVSPATGQKISGKGYSFTAPEGWKKPSSDVPGTEQADTFVADLGDDDGFADNMNVVRLDPAPIKDLDTLEPALTKELESVGAQDISLRDRAEVADETAAHVVSTFTQQGKSYRAEQYNAIHDGVSYVITFSFSPSVAEGDRDKTAASVLATWTWDS
ncbi:hypothetical protein ASE12_10135 [Aeromicrobium sp. Root236]|uniref:hypothetical protein n=1 Tax=Aeromicrobium sp. Root236 TaxID=1736498 RepID=UPI0006FA1511|nr:hypothetical protein [Aeromicrobium sp. Root236]KRC65090.1 hypothetical protein ASE12_10135 [Aeromicrobium sp. Root236]